MNTHSVITTAGTTIEPMDVTRCEAQLISLPDGRELMCPRRQNALMLWREIFDQDVYGPAARILSNGGCVLDVGANVGLSAMYFADCIDAVTIVAFEPARALNACLRYNLAQYVPSATVVCKAVGARVGTESFSYYVNSPSQSGIYADAAADFTLTKAYLSSEGFNEEDIDFLCADLHVVHTEIVEITTISNVLREQSILHVDLLKIDVERAELDVLLGVDGADWQRIQSVVMEVHDVAERLSQCISLLRTAGFSVRVWQDAWLANTELYTVHAQRP